LPEQIHKLNIYHSWKIQPESCVWRRGWKVYNLKMIGGTPVPMGVVGAVIDVYGQRKGLGISREAVKTKEGAPSGLHHNRFEEQIKSPHFIQVQ
jgi:hypothetical protein